jgi:hypothetical protein
MRRSPLAPSIALPSALVALAALASPTTARAQERSPLPPTTDCQFTAGDTCIAMYNSALNERDRAASEAAFSRGMRAFGGVSLTLGVPQLVGGIVAATQATPGTQNVGRSILWTVDGTLQTVAGLAFSLAPFERPSRPPEGAVGWIPAVVFSLASAGHVAYAAGSWLAPPQDVAPWLNHAFAAAMTTNALWYASVVVLSRLDMRHRPRGALASLSPYAIGQRDAASFGVAGRF